MTTSDYQPQRFVTPPAQPAQPVTAWQSIPQFIRFVIWLYAIGVMVSVGLVVLMFLLTIMGAGL